MTKLRKWTFDIGVNGRRGIPVTVIEADLATAAESAKALAGEIWPGGVGYSGLLTKVEDIV